MQLQIVVDLYVILSFLQSLYVIHVWQMILRPFWDGSDGSNSF